MKSALTLWANLEAAREVQLRSSCHSLMASSAVLGMQTVANWISRIRFKIPTIVFHPMRCKGTTSPLLLQSWKMAAMPDHECIYRVVERLADQTGFTYFV